MSIKNKGKILILFSALILSTYTLMCYETDHVVSDEEAHQESNYANMRTNVFEKKLCQVGEKICFTYINSTGYYSEHSSDANITRVMTKVVRTLAGTEVVGELTTSISTYLVIHDVLYSRLLQYQE